MFRSVALTVANCVTHLLLALCAGAAALLTTGEDDDSALYMYRACASAFLVVAFLRGAYHVYFMFVEDEWVREALLKRYADATPCPDENETAPTS